MGKEGKPWGKYTATLELEGNAIAKFQSSKKLSDATLYYSLDQGATGTRKWLSSKARLLLKGEEWGAEAKLPEGVTGWFINVKAGELVLSSSYQSK